MYPLSTTLPLPGYGELFRMLRWEQIGCGAMLRRAAGGVAKNKLLFAMPGSTNAVRLAMTKLILPELKHLLAELRKCRTPHQPRKRRCAAAGAAGSAIPDTFCHPASAWIY